MSYIENFYKNYNEDKRLTRKSHLPEYLLTMKYIEKYLCSGAKILEIGAGTGRYSIELAKRGYDVTAVELVEHNIEILKKKVAPHYNINIYKGNACDLSFLDSNTFDIVLLLGPMYHLFEEDERHKAISEAIRLAKTDGVIFAAYCNNETCIYKFFGRRTIISQMKKGFVTSDFRARPKNVFAPYRKSDIDNLMTNFNVKRLHFVGVDMLSYLFDNRFDKLNDKEFKLYIEYLETICEREDLVGFSIHMLDIFRKENGYDS